MSFFDDFEISKLIGQGSYGKVYIASRIGSDEEKFVAKFIDIEALVTKRERKLDDLVKKDLLTFERAERSKAKLRNRIMNELIREYEMLTLLKTYNIPHTVRYITNYEDVNLGGRVYHVIVMSRVVGFTLSTLVDCYATRRKTIRHIKIPKTFLRKIALDLLTSMAAMHLKNIVHRDVKTGNIMYDTNEHNATYIDFGYACLTRIDDILHKVRYDEEEFERLVCTTRNIGTVFAPELSAGKYKTDLDVLKAADVWALGYALYELENLTYPFKDDKAIKANDHIRSHGPDPLMNTLIDKMLIYDFKRRPSAERLADEFSYVLSREL